MKKQVKPALIKDLLLRLRPLHPIGVMAFFLTVLLVLKKLNPFLTKVG